MSATETKAEYENVPTDTAKRRWQITFPRGGEPIIEPLGDTIHYSGEQIVVQEASERVDA